MGGDALYPGALMNTYTGASDRGTRTLLVRADPRVARVRVHFSIGEQVRLLDLAPVAARPDLGLVFFAAVLAPPAALVSAEAMGAQGQVLERENLSWDEEGFQRIRRQPGDPGA
jgi:hypothetical protein